MKTGQHIWQKILQNALMFSVIKKHWQGLAADYHSEKTENRVSVLYHMGTGSRICYKQTLGQFTPLFTPMFPSGAANSSNLYHKFERVFYSQLLYR